MMRLSLSLLFFLFCAVPAQADDGVHSHKIVFGQTAVTNGPASALGIGMRDGILAAFKAVNKKGGIHGHTIDLITRDDGYEPTRAITNTQTLINKDKVFALIGGVGTPTANAILPIITKAKVPFIAPFTGANFLRTPFNRYVVNIRASYKQEAKTWIKRLTQDLGITKIAAFYQEDSYGLAGLHGVQEALAETGLELVAEGTYRRNTLAVKRAVLAIQKAKPEAIVMIGAYKPSAKFIKLSKSLGVKAKFVNISFVGSEALAKELGKRGGGVIVSQVVPFPFNAANPIVKSYQSAMKAYDPNVALGFVSMEGYMAGRLTIEILQKMKGELTRQNFLTTLYKIKSFNIDGTTLTYEEKSNQGMNKVFLTVLNKNERFAPITKLRW